MPYIVYDGVNGSIRGFLMDDDPQFENEPYSTYVEQDVYEIVCRNYNEYHINVANGELINEPLVILPSVDMMKAHIRLVRDEKLKETDWTMLLDAPITTEVQDSMRTYRQALRDMPDSVADVYNFEWPVNPLDPVEEPTEPPVEEPTEPTDPPVEDPEEPTP